MLNIHIEAKYKDIKISGSFSDRIPKKMLIFRKQYNLTATVQAKCDKLRS